MTRDGAEGAPALGREHGIRIRQAKAEDVGAASALLYSAGPEIYDYIFTNAVQTAQGFIASEFRSGTGHCGHRAVLVAEQQGSIVGVACFFDAAEHNRLQRGSLRNILFSYGFWRCWAVLARAQHAAPVISRPGPKEFCLRNFAVATERRGQGIGTALLRHGIAEAKARGLGRLILDVAETNPRARALYARLGFKPEQSMRCRNPRAAAHIPGSTRMVLDLLAC